MRALAVVLTLVIATMPAAAGDWGAKRDPFDRSVVARYKAILSRTPHDAAALTALLRLYRRYRSVDALARELETDDATWSSLVVRAHLAERIGDATRARTLFAAATRADDDDGASWLALAQLEDHAGALDAARADYQRASEHLVRKQDRVTALRAVTQLAATAGDTAAVTAGFDALTALDPRDGRLWLERGDTEASLRNFDAAVASYARAEQLLARDPEHQLLAIAARGHALEQAGKSGDAIATYERAITASPPGYYLRRELALRIVDVFRHHDTLDAAIVYLGRAWPAAQRDAFEWSTVASLYREVHDTDAWLFAMHKAVIANPAATDLQWELVHYYDKYRDPIMAMSILVNAADAAPRDVSVQLELAQRTWAEHDGDGSDRRAVAIARALSKRLPRDADAHRALAEVYARWRRFDLAIAEAKRLTDLETSDDNWILYGEVLLEGERATDALVAWRHLSAPGTTAAYKHLADVLGDHRLWSEAVDAYTTAMFGGTRDPELWLGRAVAFSELGRMTDAIADAHQAMELVGPADFEGGHPARFALVKLVIAKAQHDDYDYDDEIEPLDALMTWDTAFAADPPDVQAGYLLAEYYTRRVDARAPDVLERLHDLRPRDVGIVRALVHVYRGLHQPAKALPYAKSLLAAEPNSANAQVIAALESELPARDEPPRRDAAPPLHDCAECVAPVAFDTNLRVDAHATAGVGVRGPATATFGVRVTRSVDDSFALVLRADGVERRDSSAIAAAAGIAFPFARRSWGTLSLDNAYRVEARVRGDRERIGVIAEAGIELAPARLPVSIGAHVEQSLSDAGQLTVAGLTASIR